VKYSCAIGREPAKADLRPKNSFAFSPGINLQISRSVVKGYGYFSWQKQFWFRKKSDCEVRLLMGASPLRGRTFPDLVFVVCPRAQAARGKSSVSGEVHGNFVACLFLGRGSSPQP
jgi:hypothetical protein